MFFLIILFVMLFGMIGYGVSKSYINRKRFFFNFDLFLLDIKSGIEFSSKKITQIIQSETYTSKDFKNLLKNYLESLDGEISKEGLFQNVCVLSEQEKTFVFLFFKNLGRLDVFSQVDEIENFYITNKKYYEMASIDAGKYQSLFTKLSILVALIIVIFIV